MKRSLVFSTFIFLVLGISLGARSFLGAVEPAPELLTGELWQRMSPDAKVAFVWGIGNLVEYERARTGPQPVGSKSFIPLLVKGLAGKPINDVVRGVDSYYQSRPDQVRRPVVDAIFHAVVLPTLKAEKNGRSK